LQTGAGSPSGICFYEGDLLPKRFHNSMIHCEPGANIVRAYPTQPSGAGYTASIEPILTGTTDNWFRPADVCVAPDGSIFVTDWYDPGVGGHRQGDTDRGRLFRIAPPGNKYTVPKVDYSTTSGAIAALLSPNLATRYKAWQRLHELGRDAEVELLKLYSGADPRMRARAMWLLAQIPTREQHFIDLALSDTDPNLRIVGIRLTKHLKLSAAEKAGKLANDPSPAVRRELAVALRYDSSASMPKVWVDLAKHHDGKDRWYLEALGIGSDVRATECLDAYLAAMKNKWNTPSGRDIVWRVRAPRAAELLVSLIADEQLPLEETSRYFRSLEYQPTQVRAMSMKPLLASKAKSPRSDALIVRALERIDDKDLEKQSHIQEVIQRVISSSKGTSEFLKLVKRFQPSGIDAELRSIILSTENNSLAVQAVEVLYGSEDGPKLVRSLLNDSDDTIAARTAEVLGLQGNQRSIKMLEEIALHAERAYDVRSAAIKGLARNNLGSEKLLTAAADNKLPADTKLLAGGLLSQMSDAKIAQRAKELLPMPQSANQTPFEPLDKLVSKSGDVKRGAELYRTKGTCANCHVVGGAGKQVGPDLSEIGTKLSRDALLTSILDPSAGISHNYESYMVLLDSGQVVTGVKVSETDSEFVLRTADAIERNIRKSSIEELEKSHKSIMPDNLHQLLEQQGLIDVVEYLMTLRKK
jgi:putative heme-binding domain-containing protein